MRKPHPMALRERVAGIVDEGHGHRAVAFHFRVSPKFMNDLMKPRTETDSLELRWLGRGPSGGERKICPYVKFGLVYDCA